MNILRVKEGGRETRNVSGKNGGKDYTADLRTLGSVILTLILLTWRIG